MVEAAQSGHDVHWRGIVAHRGGRSLRCRLLDSLVRPLVIEIRDILAEAVTEVALPRKRSHVAFARGARKGVRSRPRQGIGALTRARCAASGRRTTTSAGAYRRRIASRLKEHRASRNRVTPSRRAAGGTDPDHPSDHGRAGGRAIAHGLLPGLWAVRGPRPESLPAHRGGSASRCPTDPPPPAGPPVPATRAIRSQHSFGHVRSGGPAIRVVETTKHRECGDCGSGTHRSIPVRP
jgi:hypothetical protein